MAGARDAAPGWSRRDFLRIGALGAGALALGPSLAACTGNTSTGGGGSGQQGAKQAAPKFTGGPSTAGPAKRGGTLRVGMLSNGTSETISVPGTLNLPDFARVFNLYDPMFFQAADGKTAPALIVSAEPNTDATVWTMKVRQGVEWHDGKPLTPEDILWTVQHSWANKANLFSAALSQLVDFAACKKTGADEVQIVLKHGIAQFPTLTCFPNCFVIQNGTTDFNKGIGTGPFKLLSFKPGTRSEFVANKNYWVKDKPYVDRLVIDSSYSNEQARINALLAGQIDIAPNPPSALAKANAASGRIVLGNQPGPGTTPIIMRVDKGPLANVDLRRALKYIPDRQLYVDTAFNGYGTVGNDLQGYTDQFFAADIKAEHDPDKAKSLLKKAGMSGATLTLATSAAVPGMNETASLFSQQAKAAGVKIKLNTIDPSTFFTSAAAVFERPFATSFYSIGLNSVPVLYMVSSLRGGIYNECHFGSASDDTMIFKALKETDNAKAATYWHEVQQRQVDFGGYIVPANFNYIDAYSKQVRGIQTTSALNCDAFNFKTAWLDKS